MALPEITFSAVRWANHWECWRFAESPSERQRQMRSFLFAASENEWLISAATMHRLWGCSSQLWKDIQARYQFRFCQWSAGRLESFFGQPKPKPAAEKRKQSTAAASSNKGPGSSKGPAAKKGKTGVGGKKK